MSMKLYQFEYCPYCIRVRRVLDEKGLDYEKVDVPTDREERKELLEISGQYQVPVLVDGGRAIYDSRRIIEYLEENY